MTEHINHSFFVIHCLAALIVKKQESFFLCQFEKRQFCGYSINVNASKPSVYFITKVISNHV